MSEINLKTWKRAKLLISGFKDFAERVTEELLEPRDRHSFIVQYIISFSVCIKAQRNCCAHKQKCFPMPQRRCKLDWSCVCVQCAHRGLLLESPEPLAPTAPVASTGVWNHSLLHSVDWGFIWEWGLSFSATWVQSARWTPQCLVLLALCLLLLFNL